MSDLKSARKITKALKFLRYAYVFQKYLQNVHCAMTGNHLIAVRENEFCSYFCGQTISLTRLEHMFR